MHDRGMTGAPFRQWTFSEKNSRMLDGILRETETDMEKSALFFDIDGTLLSEKTREIPESAIRALHMANKAGHLLFINTGRTICSVPAEIRRLPFDGFLCGCGTHLFFHDEELLAHSLTKELGRAVIDKVFECNLGGIAEGPEDVYFPSRISRFDKLESSRRYFREKGMGIECPIERCFYI